MRVQKRWLIGGVTAVLALAGAGAVMAQSADGGSGTFLDRVAQKLGIEPAKLEQAIEDTRKEDIDAAVERGDITQEQADRLKERIDGGESPWPGPFSGHGPLMPLPMPPGVAPFEGHRGHAGPHGGFGFAFGLDFPKQLEDLAGFLGIDVEQLREELNADDATLATVAEAHGKGRDELKSHLTGEIKDKLDQAVVDGHLAQETADEIEARAESALDEIIDGHVGMFGKGRFRFEWNEHMDGDEGSQPATPAPQRGSQRGAGGS